MVNLSPRALKNKREYDKNYARQKLQGKCITFNRTVPEDMELFEWVNSQPEAGNIYIKNLIREDMLRRKAEKANV